MEGRTEMPAAATMVGQVVMMLELGAMTVGWREMMLESGETPAMLGLMTVTAVKVTTGGRSRRDVRSCRRLRGISPG